MDEGPKPKSGKLRLNLHGTILEGKSIGWEKKREFKIKAHDLENQDAKLGSNSRIQFISNESKLVPRNLNLRSFLKWTLVTQT